MDFSEALKMLKNGTKICRSDWDIDEYLFLNDDGVIEYHSRFTTSTEPYVVDAKDVMAMDWKVYDDLTGRVLKCYSGEYAIITGHSEDGYSVLFSDGTSGYVLRVGTGSITSWECPAIKKALEQLKSIEERENK